MFTGIINWFGGLIHFFIQIKAGTVSDFKIFMALIMLVSAVGFVSQMSFKKKIIDQVIEAGGFFSMVWVGQWIIVNLLS